ncbi:MAG: glycosyltransferase family 4 protein [Nitrospirota bacterium]|nr:glycosyltransferase family 4 protein [Nitrospirota bacterium]
MKTLLLNTSDISGGAARAAYRLHKGLQSAGVACTMLVQDKAGDDPSVIVRRGRLAKATVAFRPGLDSLALKFYRSKKPVIFSLACLPDGIGREVALHNPDIVHLHWIALGFLRLETIRRFRRPIVWTLHDMWAFTGGCHYAGECTKYTGYCGRCPHLGSNSDRDISRWQIKRKLKVFADIDLTVVAPSRWLADCARESLLFKDKRIEVIPNGLDTRCFSPMDRRTARKILSLPQDKKLILFGAQNSVVDSRKGFQFFGPTLRRLAENGWSGKAELVVFGSEKPTDSPDLGLKATYLGAFQDDISLAVLYSAADVFVLPSTQDNLPNVIMEALACGTPCVAFDIGGMPDLIEHKKNGWLAEPFGAGGLADGIEWVLGDEERNKELSVRARRKVEEEFDLNLAARKYMDLFTGILSG